MKKFNLLKAFASIIVIGVLLSGVSIIADSTPAPDVPDGTVAQIDVGTPSGGVVAKEATLGSTVKKGEIVLELDKGQYIAQENIAKASLANAQQINQRNEKLNQESPGAISLQDLESSRDAVKTAEETIKLDETYVEECDVKAPFDGKVSKVVNYPGTGVGSGNEVLDVTSKK